MGKRRIPYGVAKACVRVGKDAVSRCFAISHLFAQPDGTVSLRRSTYSTRCPRPASSAARLTDTGSLSGTALAIGNTEPFGRSIETIVGPNNGPISADG